jgi:hypothetical protein
MYALGQAREGPLVGGARPAGRAGVRDGLQARRGGGGAPARGVRQGRAQQPGQAHSRLLRVASAARSLGKRGRGSTDGHASVRHRPSESTVDVYQVLAYA